MIKESLYPIELKCKLDLNSDMMLTELQKILDKNRSQLIRLIIQDFFTRNSEQLDGYFKNEINKEDLAFVLLRDLMNESKSHINNYYKSKNETEKNLISQ